jgi:type II restriction/modification system DNA methylase subunit YeeA
MTPQDFIAKWQRANLSERSAAQQHFLDLCDLLGQPKPAAADPDGAWYTFERGVHKTGGGEGWADVWMRKHFAWEYKRNRRSLLEAYQQLLRYREDLENPPLLVVCDLDRFQVHTNFTNTATNVYDFDLAHLAEPANLDVLRKLFTDPDALKPGETTEAITQEVAERFKELADGMRIRGVPAEQAAHFLMKLMFCMFAEDIELLPKDLFTKLLANGAKDPARLTRLLKQLFQAMSTGGELGVDAIAHFNGGLFADAEVIPLLPPEIAQLIRANERDWSNVEPSIFGTLFERTLDPAKRSQIGAHYTSKEDILTLLEPVLMAPLRREWAEVRNDCDKLWTDFQQARRANGKGKKSAAKLRDAFEKRLVGFGDRIAEVKVLDPACGSGNFLYVAINLLLDLEKEVITYGANHDVASWFPQVRPHQLAGLEINPYAQQLAQVVIWIGFLQWIHHNGFQPPNDPVLEPIENIRLRDAILDMSGPHPVDPHWPEADFIVGNPPFLGGKKMRSELGDGYMSALFELWTDRVRPEADLCCYWFEKARSQVEHGFCKRAGLLATQGIRGGANRDVLKRIKETGDIFFAESDRDWILEGANVHISMIGFDDGTEKNRILDGKQVAEINANLTATADITAVTRLPEHLDVAFMGDTKGGGFDITEADALGMIRSPNPNKRPSSDVVIPWVNGLDVTRRPRNMWIIDFGIGMPETQAAQYDAAFAYAKTTVKPDRDKNARESYRRLWWQHVEARPAMRNRLAPLARFLATTTVSKHRLFVWLQAPTLPDHQLIAFARADDFFFGLLQSRLHQVWGLTLGTRLETRPRYTPTTCFETFAFPEPTPTQQIGIAEAANELDRLRNAWLNPPEWTREEVLEFPGSADGPWARYVHKPDHRGIGTVRYPRPVAKDAPCAKLLAADADQPVQPAADLA